MSHEDGRTPATGDGADDGDATELPRHPVLAPFLTVMGVLLVVMTSATIYGLVRDVGSRSTDLVNVLVWSVIPGVVLAIGLRLVGETYAQRRVSWAVLLPLAYAVAVVVLGLGVILAMSAYRSAEFDRTRAAPPLVQSYTGGVAD